MKKIIFTLLAILISGSAAAEWTKVGGGDDGSDIYVDLDTIRRNGSKVKLWTMQNFKTLRRTTESKFLSTKFYWELDCKEEMARIPVILTFSGKKGSGTPVDSHHNANDTWEPVPPGTIGQTIFDAGCYSTPGAHKWTFLKTSPGQGTTTDVYFDPSSIERNEDRATIWVLFDTRSGDHAPHNDSYSTQLYREYDCREQQSRDIGGLMFSANMGIGKPYSSTDPTPWKPIVAGSLGKDLWAIACGP